jgi:hypothetical protein
VIVIFFRVVPELYGFCHCAEILDFDTILLLICASSCNEIRQTHDRLLVSYRTAVFIFSAQYWGTHDLLFAVLGTAWSTVLQYWGMHGCLFAVLWYKLSFLKMYRIWGRLESLASLLMMFAVFWDMVPCAYISEALHFQIPNSLRKVNCIGCVVCEVGGSRFPQSVCNISPFDASTYSRRLGVWACILVGCWKQVKIISLVHCRTVPVMKRNGTGCIMTRMCVSHYWHCYFVCHIIGIVILCVTLLALLFCVSHYWHCYFKR